MNPQLVRMLWTLPLALGLWFFAFAVHVGNFWFKLVPSAALLALIALILTRRSERAGLFNFRVRHLWLGPLSALVLYGVFWAGKALSTIALPFASSQIINVYANKEQLDLVLIGLLLLFVMGPAEEIYWRGFVQRSLGARFGPIARVFLATSAYALVHVVALNFILLVAAAISGLFWGWLYEREQSLVPVILSHSLWDLSIFVLFPLS